MKIAVTPPTSPVLSRPPSPSLSHPTFPYVRPSDMHIVKLQAKVNAIEEATYFMPAAASCMARIEKLENMVSELTKKIETLDITSVQKTTKKSKTPGLKKDGTPKKKRAPTGYMLFSNENRKEVSLNMIEDSFDHRPVPSPLVFKRLGMMWKAMSDEEKEAYNIKAKTMSSSDEEK